MRRGAWGIAVVLSAVGGCTDLRMTPPETGSAGAGGTAAGTAGMGGGTGGMAGTNGTAGTGGSGGTTATGGSSGGGTGGGVAGASAGTGGGGRGGTGGGAGGAGRGGTGGGLGGTGGGVGGTGGGLPEPPGLIAFWRFNEATGTTVADSSGNGQHLMLSSNARWTQLGHEGAAYAFDGATDVARVTPQANQPLADFPDIPMTLSAWIRPDAAAAARPFATALGRTHEDFLFQNFWLGLINGKPACTVHSPDMEGAVATVAAPAGAWTHIACTYGLSGDAILYVNGVRVASFATTQDLGPIPTAVLIGASETSDLHDYFPGAIDDVRMYNTTLTPAQITAIYK